MPPRPPKRDPNDLSGLRVGLYCRVSRTDKCDRCKGTGDAGQCPACNGTGYVNTGAGGQEKSTGDQEAAGRIWATRVGAKLDERHVYRDPDISASRFTTKTRPEFERLKGDIEAGKLDVVWFWELSRSQRRLDVFAELRDLCRNHGVLWVIRDRAYDPANYADMMTLGMLSVIGENESEMISLRVQRGKESSAHAGRPAGRVPYGYERVWSVDSRGKPVWERDRPNVFDGNGHPEQDSPAYVVREIFERIAAGWTLARVRDHLNDRRIPTPQGKPLWLSSSVRSIATNPVYIAKRIHRLDDHAEPGRTRQTDRVKAILEGVQGGWPPLVDEETFWAVQRIMGDPSRRMTRRGPRATGHGGPKATGGYLLSGLARCAKCGGTVYCNGGQDRYFCHFHNCVSIQRAALDAYVEGEIIGWLSDPDLAAEITSGDGYSAAAAQALADAERARAELAQLYRDAEETDVSATILTRREKRLLAAVKDAERRVQETGRLAVLGGNVGAQAKAGWGALDVAAKRLIVSTLVKVWLLPAGHNRYGPIAERVELRLITPGQDDDPPAPQAPDLEAKRRERQQAVAELRRQGVTYRQIAQQLGINPTTVWKDVRAGLA